ncbi:hypothetical protein [Streptomyces sp. NPDC056453]|uniref:hypothetical protein n=1 Tax=Streptomyces sp. NPDC056453 TaxID=3345822 RepID=UPI0036A7C4F8
MSLYWALQMSPYPDKRHRTFWARQARECGPELISLLRALPALDRPHLSVAQQRLAFLNKRPAGADHRIHPGWGSITRPPADLLSVLA